MTETLEWWKARAVRRNKEREAAEQRATEAEAKLAKVYLRCDEEAAKYKASIPDGYSAYQEGRSDFADVVASMIDGTDDD